MDAISKRHLVDAADALRDAYARAAEPQHRAAIARASYHVAAVRDRVEQFGDATRCEPAPEADFR